MTSYFTAPQTTLPSLMGEFIGGRRALAAALVAASLAAGCATSGGPSKSVDSDGTKYGFNPALYELMQRNEDVLYLRLAYSETAVRVTEISPTRIAPEGQHEEVLVHARGKNFFGPAFESSQGAGTSNSFSCAALDSWPKKLYHPCVSGSRFASTAVGRTAIVNIITVPLTLGMGAGRLVDINEPALARTVEELNLKGVVRDYLETVAHAQRLNTELASLERSAAANIEISANVKNLTGFNAPALNKRVLGLSLSFGERIVNPGRITYTPDGSALTNARSQASGQFEKIKADAKFVVRCNSSFREQGFSGSLSCPERIVHRGTADRLPVSFEVEKFSGGTRFPALSQRDKVLILSVEDNVITLTNQSSSYIEVKAITIYGGTEVNTSDVNLGLAPMSSNKSPYPVANYAGESTKRLFAFENITRGDINGKSRNFGVAVKYRVGSGGNFETLLIRRDVSLASLF